MGGCQGWARIFGVMPTRALTTGCTEEHGGFKIMNARILCILLIIIGVFGEAGCSRSVGRGSITQDELVRRTQELVNSVAGGDQGPWKKYFANDCLYFDERGRSMSKEALVADIAPLPQGYSGSISVANAQSHIEGNVAVLSLSLIHI